jgi:hypothetical protein
MRLELGEIDEATYAEQERLLLARIDEVRARRTGAPAEGGAFRVTGIEATVVGEEGSEEIATPAPPRRRRRR